MSQCVPRQQEENATGPVASQKQQGDSASEPLSSFAARESSPLLRALREHFLKYTGLTEPCDGPQTDDL